MYIIGIDTETCNGFLDKDGKLDLSQSLVYDLGYAVIEIPSFEIVKEKSFIIGDIFVEMGEAMKAAYYAEKIPQYWKEWKEGKREIVSFYTARKNLYDDMLRYNVNAVFAHNAFFDVRALNNTQRYLTKSKYRYFFKRGVEILDTLRLSQQTICKTDDYISFCVANEYMTKHKTPRPRATAEILYRYITNNIDFVESHTGLEDVKIEKEILKYITQNDKTEGAN